MAANVARLLKEERERQKLSLNSLAASAGISRQMLSYVEQEERNPSLDLMLRVSEALEIKLEEVLRKARRDAEESI
jgi:transcriptional regulator with XRE-family HTH domain